VQDAAASILCVDDDSLYLSSIARLLGRKGYRVIPCENAARALQAFESLPRDHPDLAIVDVMMPGTDGLDLTRRIRSLTKDRIPVVLLSAVGGDAAIRRGYDSGACLYLTKPCSPEMVLEVVDRVLRSKPSAPAAPPPSPG